MQLSSCNIASNNTTYNFKIYCNYEYYCPDNSIAEKTSKMDLTNAADITAVTVDGNKQHIHYIVKYKS